MTTQQAMVDAHVLERHINGAAPRRPMKLRTFFHYLGAKVRDAGMYPEPQLDTIIEPFAGSAGYALRYRDRKVLLIDKSPIVAGIWRYLLRVSPDEVRALPVFQKGGPWEIDALGPLPEEARHLIGFWVTLGTASPSRKASGWMRNKIDGLKPEGQVSWGDSFWCARVRDAIADKLKTIRHWQIIEGSYEQAPDVDATWFIDPPYDGPQGRAYPEKHIDYQALGEWCLTRKGQLIVCEQEGASWLPFEFMGTRKSTKGKTHEAIYHRQWNGKCQPNGAWDHLRGEAKQGDNGRESNTEVLREVSEPEQQPALRGQLSAGVSSDRGWGGSGPTNVLVLSRQLEKEQEALEQDMARCRERRQRILEWQRQLLDMRCLAAMSGELTP